MSTKSLLARKGAVLIAAGALVGLGVAPAAAATTVAQATANAVKITGLIDADTGMHSATNIDGVTQTSGNTNVVTQIIKLAHQEATAGLSATANADGSYDGISTGEADIAAVDALLPVDLDVTQLIDDLAANTDLLGTGIDLSGLLGLLDGLLQPVEDLLDTILQPLLTQVLSIVNITLELGAIDAVCSATPGEATGDGNVASVNVKLAVGQTVVADLPLTGFGTSVAPNTDLLVAPGAADGAAQQLVDGLVAELGARLTTNPQLLGVLGVVLAPLSSIVDTVTDLLEEPLLATLKPVLDGLVKGTVNKQTSTGTGQISVTALHLEVLNLLGGLLNIDLANVSCGPNTTWTPPATPTGTPDVPTVIDAGAAGMNGSGGIAGLMLLGTAVGVAGHRLTRSLS